MWRVVLTWWCDRCLSFVLGLLCLLQVSWIRFHHDSGLGLGGIVGHLVLERLSLAWLEVIQHMIARLLYICMITQRWLCTSRMFIVNANVWRKIIIKKETQQKRYWRTTTHKREREWNESVCEWEKGYQISTTMHYRKPGKGKWRGDGIDCIKNVFLRKDGTTS